MMNQRIIRLSALTVALFTLAACSDDDDETVVEPPAPEMRTYEITVTNLTAAQPFSPVAVIASDSVTLWQTGSAASDGLAMLAEGGDSSALTAQDETLVAEAGTEPLMPGSSETFMLTMEASDSALLSVVTMLVNTNDGFTGITGLDLSALVTNDALTMLPHVYDAGTEDNTEAAGTIPGPANGGEGASEGREALDAVTFHGGVVSAEGGLTDSVLGSEHRFDNPAMKLIITRME